jgi:hypothetical protein
MKHCVHEDVWGSGGIAPSFLTSALVGGEWSSLPPEKEPPVPIGVWVCLRAGLDAMKKISIGPARIRTPTVELIAIPTEPSRLLA